MSVSLYQCTTCKRSREIVDVATSFVNTTRCTITQGCKGSLIVAGRLKDSIRESSPPIVESLVDWQQRNILWTHTQTIATSKWRIAHNLNVPFIADVSVYVDGTLTELDKAAFTVTATDQNLVTIEFDAAYRGIAQLVTRNGSKQRTFQDIEEDQIIQVSQDGYITILDSTSSLSAGTSGFQAQVVTPDGVVYDGDQTITVEGLERTSWNTRGVLFNDLVEHKVFCVRLGDLFIVPTIGVIPDGTRLTVAQIFGRPIRRHEFLVAMTTSAAVDVHNKIKHQVVDLANCKQGIIIRRGEAFVYKSDIESITPPLRIIK